MLEDIQSTLLNDLQMSNNRYTGMRTLLLFNAVVVLWYYGKCVNTTNICWANHLHPSEKHLGKTDVLLLSNGHASRFHLLSS